MELAPELQFMHYTVAETQLPADALMKIPSVPLSELSICCDLEAHVYNPAHTEPAIVEALKGTYWTDVREGHHPQ